LLADPRVDKGSLDQTDARNKTALWHATSTYFYAAATLLLHDSRTSFDSIVELTNKNRPYQRDEMLSIIIAELTRRQMCVIYPSTNRRLWPVPIHSAADADADAACAGGDATEESDGIAERVTETECALITSFFQSRVFDVNVLRIIREYATYTCSTTTVDSD
jgi:hypothetical protein